MGFGMEVCGKEGGLQKGWQSGRLSPHSRRLSPQEPIRHGCSPLARNLQPPTRSSSTPSLCGPEEAIWAQETDLECLVSLGTSSPLKAPPDQPFHLHLQGNATHLCSQEERWLREQVATWASGCAGRRHSPGKGTLEPDPAFPYLARVGGRGELNQAPSLGMARHLGEVSGVERSEAGEAGSSCRSSVGLGLWSGIVAYPRLILPEPQPVLRQQEPSSFAVLHAVSRCLWFLLKKRSFHLN